MDLETLRLVLELLIVALAVVVWHMIRRNSVAQSETARELAAYKLHVSENYSTKNDLAGAVASFTKAVDAVFAKLDKIDDKLDRKADK